MVPVDVTTPSHAEDLATRAAGVVQGFVADGSRAMVRLDDGTTATATDALLPAEIPLLAALIVGERVSGILEGSELRPEPLLPDLGVFAEGAHTLALVVKVTDLRATVRLHPQHSAELHRGDVDAGDSPVSEVLAVGDVIRVRVRRDSDGTLALSRTDADPDAPLTPALPLVLGGPPWLSEGRSVAERTDSEKAVSERSESAPADADAVPQPRSSDAVQQPGSSDAAAASESTSDSGFWASDAAAPSEPAADLATRTDVAALQGEITKLRRDVLALADLVARSARGTSVGAAELDRLQDENEQLRARLADEGAARAELEAKLGDAAPDQRDADTALRDARRAAERSHVDATADGIRFEIERTWGNRTAPGERGRWPLREYRLGAGFVDSLAGLDEGQLSKAIRTCVDAITGRDREIPARELHRLRTGESGDDAYVVREDGARCMRSSVEQNVAGARRLHYWELPGDVVELGRIVHHDDTRP